MRNSWIVALLAATAIIVAPVGIIGVCNRSALADSRLGRAKVDVITLQKAVEAYKQKRGAWPATLDVLAQTQPDGSSAYVTPESLIDPWGQPYHLDTSQRNPETGAPLVWSDGVPDGSCKIKNWYNDDDPRPGPGAVQRLANSVGELWPSLVFGGLSLLSLVWCSRIVWRRGKAITAGRAGLPNEIELIPVLLICAFCFAVFAVGLFCVTPRYLD